MPGTGHTLLGWNSHGTLPIIQDQTTTLGREKKLHFILLNVTYKPPQEVIKLLIECPFPSKSGTALTVASSDANAYNHLSPTVQ